MYEQRKRLGLLMGAAMFQGASIGPLIDLAIQIDPRYADMVWNLLLFIVYLEKYCS